jgi:hypothetical protein
MLCQSSEIWNTDIIIYKHINNNNNNNRQDRLVPVFLPEETLDASHQEENNSGNDAGTQE